MSQQQPVASAPLTMSSITSALSNLGVEELAGKLEPWQRVLLGSAFVTASAAVLFRKKLILWVCDALASSRPNPGKEYLEGAYGPVDKEVHTTELQVEGQVPAGLEGAFIRTGPNPMFKPTGAYHIFDGDGMVHTVKLSGGKATSYSNRYVETSRLKQERAAGRALFMKMGDMWGATGLALIMLSKLKSMLGVVDMSQGRGTANTALVYHARRLLALHEGDLPYQLRILCSGIVETLGRLMVGGGEGAASAFPQPFTAHPKVDPVTGEMYFFGYSMQEQPYVRAGMMDAKGNVTKQWMVDVPYPSMMHDCGLTQTYALVLLLPLTFLPKKMIKENTLPLGFDPSLPSRIGLLRRDSPGCPGNIMAPDAPAADVQWIDIPTSFIFHVANAWEDVEGLVHLVACRYDKFNFHGFNQDLAAHPYPEDEMPHMTEIILDPKQGKMVSLTTLSKVCSDFPVVHPDLATRTTRYTWTGVLDYKGQLPTFPGVAKFDLSLNSGGKQDACVAQITFPPGSNGGEAIFVPRPGAVEEDDGWLLVYVQHEPTGQSALHIYDARTMDSTPLARVRLPQRVPFGFHGMFVRKAQLEAQRTTL